MRAAVPLSKTEKDWNTNKIRAIIKSVHGRVEPHKAWSDEEEQQCKAQFARVLATLSKDHFEQVRIANKRTRVDGNAKKFKKQSVVQQTKQQHQTSAVSGLIPIGKLFQTKEGHLKGLKAELLFRGRAGK